LQSPFRFALRAEALVLLTFTHRPDFAAGAQFYPLATV